MIPIIVAFLCTSPRLAHYHTDENGYSYVEETHTAPQSFPCTSPDSLPQMPGWPKNIHSLAYGVCLADVNQDGCLEILLGTRHGSFHVWDYQGNCLPGWPKVNLDSIASKPAVADIDPGYPGQEIVVVGKVDTAYAWHCDGSIVTGWPRAIGETGAFKSPAIFDIDDDGDLEIIVGQRYYPRGRVIILNHDGSVYPGWPQYPDYMCGATPSVADVDMDGEIEICATDYRGLFLWDKDGNLEPGWPILNPEWISSYAQAVLADLDNDGDLEILAPYSYGPPIFTGYVAIYHHDGTNFTNWPQEFPGSNSYTTSVVADIDNDGDLEIFGGGHNLEPAPCLLARHHTGDSVVGWPVVVDCMECSPVVLDLNLNDNWRREILTNNNRVFPLGDFYAFDDDGTLVPGWPQNSGASGPNSPSVGDVDNDGDIEIAFVAESLVYLWTMPDVEYRPYMVEWGTWFHDNWNTGWFHPKAPQNLIATSAPTSVYLTWDANTESDIAGYNVYRSGVSGGSYVKINDTLITGTDYSDVPPLSGPFYYYCITAQIEAGTESRLSNEVSGYVGIEENVDLSTLSFSVFPNPFSNVINFNISSKQSLNLKIYDCKGALVDALQGLGFVQWRPKKGIPTGIYFVETSNRGRSKTIKKIIKLN
jgi:hypothetical protein